MDGFLEPFGRLKQLKIYALIMCSQVMCRKCGKATWSGCGQHIEDALRGVPKSQRCQGHESEPSTGIFKRLFGKKN
jgi:hypothetical protein